MEEAGLYTGRRGQGEKIVKGGYKWAIGRLKIAGWVKRRQGCIWGEEGRRKGQWSGGGIHGSAAG